MSTSKNVIGLCGQDMSVCVVFKNKPYFFERIQNLVILNKIVYVNREQFHQFDFKKVYVSSKPSFSRFQVNKSGVFVQGNIKELINEKAEFAEEKKTKETSDVLYILVKEGTDIKAVCCDQSDLRVIADIETVVAKESKLYNSNIVDVRS